MGESSAILSPANRRVNANPFGSLPPPKPYGLPERNEPEVGWSAMARRHQFLLLMLGILTFLCTVYLYFAITMGARDSCAGLQGTQRAACRVAKGGLGHRRLLEEGDGNVMEQASPSCSGVLEADRSGRDLGVRRDSHVTDDDEEPFLFLQLQPLSDSFSAHVTNKGPANVVPCSLSRGPNWCLAPRANEDRFHMINAIHLLRHQPSRQEAIAMLSDLDRVLRPGRTASFRDTREMEEVVREAAPSLKWEVVAFQDGGNASPFNYLSLRKAEEDVGQAARSCL